MRPVGLRQESPSRARYRRKSRPYPWEFSVLSGGAVATYPLMLPSNDVRIDVSGERLRAFRTLCVAVLPQHDAQIKV